MKRLVPLPLLAVLATAGTAAAAVAGTVAVTVAPDTPHRASGLHVSAAGPFTDTYGMPKSITVRAQRGFSSSARSVPVLCSSSQETAGSCPAASQVGGGNAVVTATYSGLSKQDTITLTGYLGVPLRQGDIASVMVTGTDSVLHETAHSTGRLFATRAGLELLFDQLPTFTPPQGVTVTLDSLDLSARAVRTVTRTRKGRHGHRRRRKVTYSLIRNPGRCATGHWTGSLSIAFQSGTVARTVNIPCHR